MTGPLVPGDQAPQIQGHAVQQGEIVDLTLDDALKGAEYLLLAFYPADFTFVCPTEIVQFMEKNAEFAKQQCNVWCCSTDSAYTHLAWLKAPKSERGLGATGSSSIVLLSDRSHEISRAYGVLASSGNAYRGTFLIDKNKTICQVTINDMPVGRSVDDALRMLTEMRGRSADGGASASSNSSNYRQRNSSNAIPSAFMESSFKMPGQLQSQQLQLLTNQQKKVILQLPTGLRTEPAAQAGDLHLGQHLTSRMCQYPLHPQQSPPSVTITTDSSDQQQDDALEQQQPPPQAHYQQQSAKGWVARAARLETRAVKLRLRDSEARLAQVLAEADRLRAEAERKRSDTERLKAEARMKQVELDRLMQRGGKPAAVAFLAPPSI